MRRHFLLILLVVLAFCTFSVAAEEKKPVFETLRCGMCHKADTGQANPSLKAIATAYNGDKGKLTGYLQGSASPIVKQEKGKIMERYVEKTKALSQEEINALADFILSNK